MDLGSTPQALFVGNDEIGADLYADTQRRIYIWDITCRGAQRGWHYSNGVIYASALGMAYNGVMKEYTHGSRCTARP